MGALTNTAVELKKVFKVVIEVFLLWGGVSVTRRNRKLNIRFEYLREIEGIIENNSTCEQGPRWSV